MIVSRAKAGLVLAASPLEAVSDATVEARPDRRELLGHSLRLEYLTVGWNVVEGVIAIAAASAAASVALLGFGLDSFVESASGLVLVWRLRAEGSGSEQEHVEALEERIGRLDEKFEFGFMERDTYAAERSERMAELETLKAVPEEPTSLMARREELRTLVDDWGTARNETRRALLTSVFESLRPTASGGMVAEVRPGWRQHAAAAATASREAVCFERRRRESNPR